MNPILLVCTVLVGIIIVTVLSILFFVICLLGVISCVQEVIGGNHDGSEQETRTPLR